MATWPVSLQQHWNVEGFSLQIGETVLTSDVDAGPTKKRRRFTKSVDIYSFSINLKYSDFQIFYDFFNIDCNGGVTPFTFNDPITSVSSSYRFTSPPSMQPLDGGIYFSVSGSVEKMP